SKRKIDLPLIFLWSALDHRPIGLAHAAVLEQPPERRQRLAVAAEHQATRRIAIKPVRERRCPRQPEAQRVEMVFQAFAAFRTLVDRKAGRLVDNEHEPIAVDEARYHLFRCHGETAITARNMNDSTNSDKPKGWWQRLTGGLRRTSSAIGTAISDLVSKRKL